MINTGTKHSVKHLVKQLAHQLVMSGVVLLLVLQVFVGNSIAAEVADMPDLVSGETSWVTDLAKVISSSTENAVNDKLQKLEAATGKQVHFVTVQRLDFAKPASEFATELFDRWFPTDADKANQALILIATEDYRTAIATGKNIQALVSDPVATSIATETVLFPAQKANFNQAVIDGTERLATILAGEPDPGPPVAEVDFAPVKNFKTAAETDTGSSTILVIVLLLLATAIPMVTYYWLNNSNG